MRNQNFGKRTFGSSEPMQSIQPAPARRKTPAISAAPPAPPLESAKSLPLTTAAERVINVMFERIDIAKAAQLDSEDLRAELKPMIHQVAGELGLQLSASEEAAMEEQILNELTGLGPLEPLLKDPDVSDILVNAPDSIYFEKGGKLERYSASFRDNAHVEKVAKRIAGRVGRRIDLSSPLVDARLADGSRVNIVIPPVALKGCSLSIRKFSANPLGLEDLVGTAMSEAMANTLRVAARARFNIIISGGTGSGKTTMLNALSSAISPSERIITIEDAAELQLQQPHVVTLESRPPSVDGTAAVDIADLLRNALRMRPDRIILGEVRGPEAFNLMQAMNTGHDGSLATLHASSTREALTRLQNMVMAGQPTLSTDAVKQQIAKSVDLVVQVRRFASGVRRVTAISEVAGMEGETVLIRDLYQFRTRELPNGEVTGDFVSMGASTDLGEKARLAGLEAEWRASL